MTTAPLNIGLIGYHIVYHLNATRQRYNDILLESGPSDAASAEISKLVSQAHAYSLLVDSLPWSAQDLQTASWFSDFLISLANFANLRKADNEFLTMPLDHWASRFHALVNR